MKSIEELARKAMELKERGMTNKEIATELHLSTTTVRWLLERRAEEKPPVDVKIGWRSIGIYPHRMALISQIFVDIIYEEMAKRDFTVDSIVGINVNGVPYATFMAEEMGVELIIYRPHPQRKEGAFSSNYASIKNKNVVIVDDVMSTGETMERAIEDVRREGANPVLCLVLVNKTAKDEVAGVPLRGLIRARVV